MFYSNNFTFPLYPTLNLTERLIWELKTYEPRVILLHRGMTGLIFLFFTFAGKM